MRVFLRAVFTTLIAGIILPSIAFGGITIGSFNIKHLGWDNGKNYQALGEIAQHFDVFAAQEVMSEEGAQRLHSALERASNESWSYQISHTIGRGSYQEAYAIFSRDSAAEYVDGAVVYLDRGDTFAREPYSARYRSLESGQVFALGTVHILYGDSTADRTPEIRELDEYWDWLGEAYPDTPRVLVGDFNLDASHKAFQGLLSTTARLGRSDNGSTTLSSIDGRYANNYDHIFISDQLNVTDSGVLRFPQWLGVTHEEARDSISDHAPVWVGLNGGKVTLPGSASAGLDFGAAANDASYGCVDINEAQPKALARLPHIGPARAKAVMKGRPWGSLQELTRIRGIGEGRLGDIVESEEACEI